jgi:hypothetical protein
MSRANLEDIDGTVLLHNGREAFDWEKMSEYLPNTCHYACYSHELVFLHVKNAR